MTTALTAKQILEAVDEKGVSFLDVLIACEQKHVVKQQVVQNYLTEIWNGGQDWSTAKALLLLISFMLLPPVWLAFSLPIRHRWIRVPLIRFFSYLVSNIYLIALFALVCTWPLEPVFQEVNNPVASWNEWLLLAWLAGYLVCELTNPSDSKGFGLIRLVVIASSACGVICHVVAVVLSSTAVDQAYDCFYLRNLFFAVAMLCAFIALIDFLTFHHMFGPWSIIIKALLNDLIRFLVILAIFVAGFTFNITTLYNYVTPNPNNPSDNTVGSQTALSVFEACFWGIFGFLDPTFLPPVDRTPYWTLALSKIYFGLYLLIVFHVLVNILIAMLTDTYQEIQDKSDKEWKFGRAKLIRNMSKTCPSPSPLILLTKLLEVSAMLLSRMASCPKSRALYFYEAESSESRTAGDLTGRSPAIQAGLSVLRARRTRVSPEPPEQRDRQASISGPSRSPHTEPKKEMQKIETVVDWKAVCVRLLAEDSSAMVSDWRKPGVHKRQRQ